MFWCKEIQLYEVLLGNMGGYEILRWQKFFSVVYDNKMKVLFCFKYY